MLFKCHRVDVLAQVPFTSSHFILFISVACKKRTYRESRTYCHPCCRAVDSMCLEDTAGAHVNATTWLDPQLYAIYTFRLYDAPQDSRLVMCRLCSSAGLWSAEWGNTPTEVFRRPWNRFGMITWMTIQPRRRSI